MATTFNPEEPLAGLPPKHLLEGAGAYSPVFKDNLEKEIALSLIKKTFEDKLKENVDLTRVSCPLFVTKRSGFNDNLVSLERRREFGSGCLVATSCRWVV
jgi:aspartate--ammonia ligase